METVDNPELARIEAMLQRHWKNSKGDGHRANTAAVAEVAETVHPQRVITPAVLTLYALALSRLSPEACQRALARVVLEKRFLPSPREILALAGEVEPLSIDEQWQSDARKDLAELFAQLREFGPKLKPRGGGITPDDTCEAGYRREPIVTPPLLPETVRGAAYIVGFGDFYAGFVIMAQHSAVAGQNDNMNRVDADVERRWMTAWRESKLLIQAKEARG
jgi:hypothetical protein